MPSQDGKKSIMIATPCYGGLLHNTYVNSVLLVLFNERVRQKFNIMTTFMGNDALIQRARQECVKTAMDEGADKILFVDADISFTPEDFMNVVDTNLPVVGGTYRKKCAEPVLNFNLPAEVEMQIRKDLDDEYAASNSLKGFKHLRKNYIDQATGLVRAQHLATGFLCIDLDVIRKLKQAVPNYVSDRRSNHKFLYTKEEMAPLLVPEVFPVTVQNNILESEDWGFCRLCHENGIPIYLNTSVVLHHIGNLALVFPKDAY